MLHSVDGSCRLASKVAIPLKSIITAGISTKTSARKHYCYQTTKTSLPISRLSPWQFASAQKPTLTQWQEYA
jgi:hypothetical protein